MWREEERLISEYLEGKAERQSWSRCLLHTVQELEMILLPKITNFKFHTLIQ